MTAARRFALVLALAMLLILTTFLAGCSLGSAARDATNAGLAAGRAWYEAEGRALLKSEGAKLLEEGQSLLLEKGKAYTDSQVAKLSANFAASGVDASKIDSIAAAREAYQKVREEEKRTGVPYQSPLTGSLLADTAIALFLARYAGKGVDMATGKLMRRPPPSSPPEQPHRT